MRSWGHCHAAGLGCQALVVANFTTLGTALALAGVHVQVSQAEAHARISAANEPYKAEILESIAMRDPAAPITIYHIGEEEHPEHWWDVCAGPHVATTGSIHANAFELESVAGRARAQHTDVESWGFRSCCCATARDPWSPGRGILARG